MNGKIEAQKTWGASPTGWTSAREYKPGTKEFFDKANHFRDNFEQPWLTDVVPFHQMAGKRVLEIGFGPGYDAIKFIKAGADYSGVDITPENVERTKKHLAHFGLTPNVQQGDAENLPFPDTTFDVVYSNGVLHHVPDMEKAFREARRVLKPGGQFIVLLYNKYSVFYIGLVLVHYLTGGFRSETLAQRRSRIEASSADAAPIVNVYSKNELGKILNRQGFNTQSITVRKCTPEDFPASAKVGKLYRIAPPSFYRAMGRAAGWYLIANSTVQRHSNEPSG
jgi:ubiquinone/menaquinone biosynthesis C-methylase UbiE